MDVKRLRDDANVLVGGRQCVVMDALFAYPRLINKLSKDSDVDYIIAIPNKYKWIPTTALKHVNDANKDTHAAKGQYYSGVVF